MLRLITVAELRARGFGVLGGLEHCEIGWRMNAQAKRHITSRPAVLCRKMQSMKRPFPSL